MRQESRHRTNEHQPPDRSDHISGSTEPADFCGARTRRFPLKRRGRAHGNHAKLHLPDGESHERPFSGCRNGVRQRRRVSGRAGRRRVARVVRSCGLHGRHADRIVAGRRVRGPDLGRLAGAIPGTRCVEYGVRLRALRHARASRNVHRGLRTRTGRRHAGPVGVGSCRRPCGYADHRTVHQHCRGQRVPRAAEQSGYRAPLPGRRFCGYTGVDRRSQRGSGRVHSRLPRRASLDTGAVQLR